MTGGVPSSAVDAVAVIPAIPIESEYTETIYRRLRSR